MKIPGLWRVRHFYIDTLVQIKKRDEVISFRMQSLISSPESRTFNYRVRNIKLPSQKTISQITSRKELLAISQKHDLSSFYTTDSEKETGLFKKKVKEKIYTFFFFIYRCIRKALRLINKIIKLFIPQK